MNKTLDNVTCITIVYKTVDLMKNVYESLRRFYPTIKYLVIDNSGGDECTRYLEELALKDVNLQLIKMESNVGHGAGMRIGIENATTDFLFIFDSDIIFFKGGFIEKALEKMDEDTYAIGWVLDLDMGGRNIHGNYKGEILKYVFDGFWFLNRNLYPLYPKLTKYGLPLFQTMLYIHKNKLERVIKPFDFRGYLKHLFGGTRGTYGDCEDIVPGFKGRKGDNYTNQD